MWGGFQKWVPRNLCLCLNPSLSLVMLIADVLLEIMTFESICCSNSSKTSSFADRFSSIASIMKSASLQSDASSSQRWTFSIHSSIWLCLTLSSSRNTFRFLWIRSGTEWRTSAWASKILTAYPCVAKTWAIPWPIKPAPTMPIFRISVRLNGTGVSPPLVVTPHIANHALRNE